MKGLCEWDGGEEVDGEGRKGRNISLKWASSWVRIWDLCSDYLCSV